MTRALLLLMVGGPLLVAGPGLEERIKAALAAHPEGWIGWAVPGPVHPEDAPMVLLGAERGELKRLRTSSLNYREEHPVKPETWLERVDARESIEFLRGLVGTRPEALHMIAQHDHERALAVLLEYVAPGQEEKLREQALFGLSMARRPEGEDTLVRLSKEDKSTRIRGRALFWLGHRGGERARLTIEKAIAEDADAKVRKDAVFALSRLPKESSTPALIRVAKSASDGEVRKQAVFWLGRSKDPKATEYLEALLAAR